MDAFVGVLSLLFFVVMTVISIVSLVAYTRTKAGMRKRHGRIISGLAPCRQLSTMETRKFNTLYRKKIPVTKGVFVYKHAGPVEYISLSVNHAESKEYSVGGIMIAGSGLTKLSHVLTGVDLTVLARETAERSREKTMAVLERYAQSDAANGEAVVKELKAVREEFSHSVEVVFPDNNTSRPGFLVQFDEWNLAGTWESGVRNRLTLPFSLPNDMFV
jgi:hypothetical protein